MRAGKKSQASSHQQRTSDVQAKNPNEPPISLPPAINVVNQQTTHQQSNRAKDNPEGYFSRLFSPENLPSIGLLIAGVVGIMIAIRTLCTISKQTDVMEKTLILTQRPRLQVRNLVIDIPSVHSDSEPLWNAYFNVANAGGTAAQILESHCMGSGIKMLPMKRPFEGIPPNNPIDVGIWIEPGESHTGHFTIIGKEFHVSDFMSKDPEHFHSLTPYYIIGFIKYKDRLGIFREVVFCRRFDFEKRRFLAVDDPDYEYSD